MNGEILINLTSREVRAAVVEGGVLREVLIERASRRGLTGNIYKGRVARVLPGMQAAFVEIGLARTGFLHASDVLPPPGITTVPGVEPDIRQLLREGDTVLVQVVKDQLGTKGARLSSFITMPSRYLVLMPREATLGVSGRIESEDERTRLKQLVASLTADGPGHGYIVRTAAEGVGEDQLRADLGFLHRLWEVVVRQAENSAVPSLVHRDLPLAIRVLRDLANAEIHQVRLDDAAACDELRRFAGSVMPELTDRIELYPGPKPIFDLYGIEDEIQKALERKVELKSGGYLVIDQTEALTSIDVNTGGFVGHRNLEDTIFRTNLEAAVAIARQLRLRNLGGIIIIDFIDMIEEGHRRQVLEALNGALAGDAARPQVAEVSPLGLVQMTRKRTRESLEHILCEACPTCEGRGQIKTPETVCYEIFREILRQHAQFRFKELVILAHQEVIELLLDEESAGIAELEALTGKSIRLQVEGLYGQDQFDVVLV
ncbi:MAG: ribonuclease G [Gammaproteobacteria bacterium]|nr:ribonuclease G [Gammaproteobacteria bacterium]